MSLLRCSACFLVLLFFTFCSVNCKGTAAGHDLRTWSRESGAVARSLKSIVEQYTIDLTVGDAAFVGNRHLLQEKPKDEADEVSEETDTKSDKKKDEVSEETDAKSNKKKDEVEEKPDESDSKAKTDDMTMEEEKIEAKTKTETKMNTKTDTEDKAEAEPPTEAETEPEPKTKTKKSTAAKTKKEAEADLETDVEDGSDVEAEGDGEEAKKIVKTNSDKKEDSDAKSGEGKKSSKEKDGKSVDDVPEKEKIEAEAETEPEAEDKDVAKTKVVEKVSAKKKGKSKAESDVEEKEPSTNKDTKPEENSKKAVGAKIKADTVEKAEADDSPDEGEETDPVTKKGDKKSKVNNVKKEKKNKKNILKKEKKKEPKTVEPKKKPTPVVVKKVQPTVPSDCVWNNDSKSCFVDKKPFSKILSKAKSKSGKVLLQEYECLDLDQVSCNKMDGCEWLGSCQSTSYIKAQNKCFGSGSGFIYHLDGTCDTHSEQSACSLNDKCMWLSDMQKCAVDFVKAFTGVSIDGQEVQNTRSSRNGDLQATFNANVGNFVNNPDSILDWTLPAFNCPDGVEPTVCEFAMVFDREFVLNKHCGAKYDITDISECNLDPLCEIGIDAACGISPVMRNEVARSGSEVLANAAKSSLGTQYIELINACQKGPSNVEGVGCEPGCLLDENSCIVDTDTFIQQTVFKSKSFKGGQCKGFPLVLGDSGCKDLNEKACQAKKECSLDGDDVCIPNKKEKILGALLEMERPVASAAKAATKKCGSFNTKSKCEMPKVL